MLISEFAHFVEEADQSRSLDSGQREDIFLYGLASEIGSLVAAIKRKLRWDENSERWNVPNAEIRSELGDALWYCFAISALKCAGGAADLFTLDVRNLRASLGAEGPRSKTIRETLDTRRLGEFLSASESFVATKNSEIDDYQRLAYLTARTKGRVLLEVCLAVLWQLGAELLRRKLPDVERTINQNIADRDVIEVVGEILWHLAALATLYELSLSDIALANAQKVAYRKGRGHPTPLHDNEFPKEQFPRKFQVAFVRVAEGRSRMYIGGRQLGDDLTDNARDEDGYRFHDVLHLANIAKLGWSPVFRALMKKKRKSNPLIDEVEDGARAQIAEEAVVKFIHGEGVRLAKERFPHMKPETLPLFSDTSYISHGLLTSLRDQIIGLEVEKNRYWEWADCIMDGYRIFNALRKEHQGTVTLDLNERMISFDRDVELDIAGIAAGIGSASTSIEDDATTAKAFLSSSELSDNTDGEKIAAMISAKKAILDSIGFFDLSTEQMNLLEIKLRDGNRVSFRAAGEVQERMWQRKVVTFKIALASLPSVVTCTALAITDLSDSSKPH